MNQEQVLYKINDVTKLSGEFLLRALYFILTEGTETVKGAIDRRPVAGEVNYNRFMNTESTKLVETFKASELHVTALKDYLKQYGVAFAVKKQDDGLLSLVFEAKNKAVVAEAFSQTLDQLTKTGEGEKLLNHLKLTPEKLPFEEKLHYFENKVSENIKAVEKLNKGAVESVTKEKSL